MNGNFPQVGTEGLFEGVGSGLWSLLKRLVRLARKTLSWIATRIVRNHD